jgi:hypothetical protein
MCTRAAPHVVVAFAAIETSQLLIRLDPIAFTP